MAQRGKREGSSSLIEIVVVLAIVIAGQALQLLLGEFDNRALQFPINLILAIALLSPLLFRKSLFVKRVSSPSLSIYIILLFAVLSLFMGLIPNNGIKLSWPFVLLYLLLLINLSALLSRRLIRFAFNLREVAFLMNHFGLFLLLFAMGPGAADKERYFLTVREGETEWRGERSFPSKSEVVELPIAVELENFYMEEYPPKLVALNINSGKALPLDRPPISTKWSVVVDSTIERHASAPTSFISITDFEKDSTYSAEVTCGNYFQHFKLAHLNDSLSIAMTTPEPKLFRSKVILYEQSGKSKEGFVEVNHPLQLKGWRVYQYSYDRVRGKASEYSIFELVYDRWSSVTYTGLIMLLIGSLLMFWQGVKR